MSREIVREWHFWLASIMTGVFMAFVYDLIRLIRRLVRHARIIVDLEDILYWTACFGLSFTLLYYGNNGVIRFAAVLGAAVGMFFYALTIGRFFVKWCYFVIDKTIGRLFRFVKHFFVGRFHKLFTKIRLTCAENRHKMKMYLQKKAKGGKE
ncbi:MAG: spore cortex biosynthesis protein YabQ, partial [Lachnospiraceae bacterium]|nr:spore cortex biosynthesis protein YabQ [Lachnospiraceae bacterium]